MELVAEGTSLTDLSSLDSMFKEGETGVVRIFLTDDMSVGDIAELERQLVEEGVVLTAPIAQDARVLEIHFQKASFPLLIIAALVAGAALVGIFGWQLFSGLSKVPWWAWMAGIFGLGYLALRKRSVV